jgi:hypothetical protein
VFSQVTDVPVLAEIMFDQSTLELPEALHGSRE